MSSVFVVIDYADYYDHPVLAVCTSEEAAAPWLEQYPHAEVEVRTLDPVPVPVVREVDRNPMPDYMKDLAWHRIYERALLERAFLRGRVDVVIEEQPDGSKIEWRRFKSFTPPDETEGD